MSSQMSGPKVIRLSGYNCSIVAVLVDLWKVIYKTWVRELERYQEWMTDGEILTHNVVQGFRLHKPW
jgi:hypothetical protein